MPTGQTYGFYTTRWVRAADEQTATSEALTLVEHEIAALKLLNPADQPHSLVVEEIVELPADEEHSQGAGFTFFIEESN